MVEIKPDIETFAKIKVIGVGGSGGSAITRMIQSRIKGVDFIAANTDVQALYANQAAEKIHIGRDITKGLGAGMNPDLGRRAAEESQSEIKEILSGADMIFITCGLGGGTGTGAAPIIADIAREMGILTIAVVTKPFDFEGAKRKEIAERGFADLKDRVDTIITIPNERLFQIIDKKTSLLEAFNIADEVLRQGVQGISDIITVPGLINVDFADVRTIMEGAGSALMGIGEASGEDRAVEAAKAAVASPLLDLSMDGASGVLFTITASKDLGMHEINEAARVISEQTDNDAKIIFGAIIDEELQDTVKITVFATGFGDSRLDGTRDGVVSNYGTPVVDGFIKPERVSEKERSAPALTPTPTPVPRIKSIFSRSEKVEEEKKPEPIVEPEQPQDSSPASSSKTTPSFDNLSDMDADDLDIPAFIRKKMG